MEDAKGKFKRYFNASPSVLLIGCNIIFLMPRWYFCQSFLAFGKFVIIAYTLSFFLWCFGVGKLINYWSDIFYIDKYFAFLLVALPFLLRYIY